MIIDNNNKFVFVAIAKTACTSVHRRFDIHEDPIPSIYHMHLRDILEENPDAKDYYKFAFVRNPYDRLLSAYYNFRFSPEHKDWAYPIYKYDMFRDFVLDIENSGCLDFIHLSSQFDFLRVGDSIGADFVGRYENLNEDFAKVETHLGLSHVELPVVRTSRHPHYTLMYDDEMKKKVQEIYEKDFEEFGYER